MNKKMILLPIILLSMSLGQVTFAMHNKCPSMGWRGYMEHAKTTLKLTPEQQKKIKDIKKHAKDSMKPEYEEMKSIRAQMHGLIKSEKLDEANLDKLIEKKKEVLGSIMKKKAMVKHEVYGVLTDEQKAKYGDMVKTWKEKQKKYWKHNDKE